MKTMKAVRLHTYGAPDRLVYEENVPRPEPAQNQVLVKIYACGVGPWDAEIRRGDWKGMVDYPLPLILGTEVAGKVAEVGSDVTNLQVGQDVYGVADMTLSGANAEYGVSRSTTLAAKPKTLDYLQAAAVPVVAVTAWQMLFDLAQLQSHQTVLVHGAAGSVGRFAVQLAKRLKAHVIGTASAKDVEAVRALGADEAIDYRTIPFEQVVQNVDVVLDTVGGDTRQRSFAVLKPGGILIASSAPLTEAEQAIAKDKGVRAEFVESNVTTDLLNEITALLDDHQLTIQVGSVLPLEQAKRAHEMMENHQLPSGKLVLQVVH